MQKLDLSGITVGNEAARFLGKPTDAHEADDVKRTVQRLNAEFSNYEATFHADHSPDDFRELERRRAAVERAERCVAAGDLRQAFLAVIASWDGE